MKKYFLVLIVVAAGFFTQPAFGEVSVERTQKERVISADNKYHPDHRFLDIFYEINSGKITYRLPYKRCQDPSHKGNAPSVTRGAVDLLSGIGLDKPMYAGWYCNSFIDVVIDGVSLGTYQANDKPYMEDDKGGVVFIWETPVAKVSIDFFMFPYEDGLYALISVDPKSQLKNDIEVKLYAYPSIYKRDGNRVVESSLNKYEQRPQDPYLFSPAEKEYWLFYADTIYDGSQNIGKGRGPCSFLFEPGAPKSIKLDVGSYGVATSVLYPSAQKQIRMCFFEFERMSNEKAMTYFKSLLNKVKGHLCEGGL